MNVERAARLLRRTEARTRHTAYWLRTEPVSPPAGDFVQFLGTGGNPSGVIGQRRRTGGIWLSLGGAQIALDPGPGAAFHAARGRLDTRALDAILVSHGHTDHYLGAGALIEGMCRGMSRHRGALYLTESALTLGLLGPYHLGREPSPWYQGGPLVETWRIGESATIGPVRATPFVAHHGPENYGISFACGARRIVYSSDTTYVLRYRDQEGQVRDVVPGEPLLVPREITQVREDIVAAFSGADVAILNVSFFWQHAHRHLTAVGAADLLRRAGVRMAVITHFDVSAALDAAEIAEFVASESGVPTIAARDGQRLPLFAGQHPAHPG